MTSDFARRSTRPLKVGDRFIPSSSNPMSSSSEARMLPDHALAPWPSNVATFPVGTICAKAGALDAVRHATDSTNRSDAPRYMTLSTGVSLQADLGTKLPPAQIVKSAALCGHGGKPSAMCLLSYLASCYKFKHAVDPLEPPRAADHGHRAPPGAGDGR